MKKNRMMRLASGLLVAVLATTSVISGTYAKYVTQDSANDTARVAKWGVTVLASGSLFGQHYKEEDVNIITSEEGASVAIESEGEDNIVAPGTANEEGLTFAVSGTPEVSTEIEVAVNEEDAFEEIWLAAGNYGVMVDVSEATTADNYHNTYIASGDAYVKVSDEEYDEETEYFELIDLAEVAEGTVDTERYADDKYYPVIWTVTDSAEETGTYLTVAEVAEAIKGEAEGKLSGTYDPNVNLANASEGGAGKIAITWEWPFEVEDNAYVDAADTILGNLIAYVAGTSNYQVVVIGGTAEAPTYTGVTVTDGVASANETEVANLEVAFNAKVTVTQVN